MVFRGLPDQQNGVFLTYTGMETDLIFTQKVALPEFASFPLLETMQGRAALARYYRDLIDLGRKSGLGVVLEAPTWMANRDRAAPLGYDEERLQQVNVAAIDFVEDIRRSHSDVATVLSANIGPRDDAYAPEAQMSAQTAEAYHRVQMAALAQTKVDLISGYTLAYCAEAIGIVRAAQKFDLAVVIAFTVETDGRLPTGETVADAIAEVDAATGAYARYFMINCAHPEHFTSSLTDAPEMARMRGVVANASRCSHAELDNATVLDDGDPAELGAQLGALQQRLDQICVVGGCCGTDMRHMAQIAAAVS